MTEGDASCGIIRDLVSSAVEDFLVSLGGWGFGSQCLGDDLGIDQVILDFRSSPGPSDPFRPSARQSFRPGFRSIGRRVPVAIEVRVSQTHDSNRWTELPAHEDLCVHPVF